MQFDRFFYNNRIITRSDEDLREEKNQNLDSPDFQTFLRPCMSFSCDSQYVTSSASPSTLKLEFKSSSFNVQGIR